MDSQFDLLTNFFDQSAMDVEYPENMRTSTEIPIDEADCKATGYVEPKNFAYGYSSTYDIHYLNVKG